jgi:hypothetical protein
VIKFQNILRNTTQQFWLEQSVIVLVMEIGWTDVGSGGYILVSCAHSNTSFSMSPFLFSYQYLLSKPFSSFPNIFQNPPLFTGKLVIKFQNILRNTTQVIIRHRVKILFCIISSPITLERQKWKLSKKERELWRKRGFLPYVVWVAFLRMFWNFISSLLVKRGGPLSILVGTISNVFVMEIGWTDVGSGGIYLSELCSQ